MQQCSAKLHVLRSRGCPRSWVLRQPYLAIVPGGRDKAARPSDDMWAWRLRDGFQSFFQNLGDESLKDPGAAQRRVDCLPYWLCQSKHVPGYVLAHFRFVRGGPVCTEATVQRFAWVGQSKKIQFPISHYLQINYNKYIIIRTIFLALRFSVFELDSILNRHLLRLPPCLSKFPKRCVTLTHSFFFFCLHPLWPFRSLTMVRSPVHSCSGAS